MHASAHEAKLAVALECLASSGCLTLRVTGLSMMPEIRPGSRVRIRSARAADVAPGEVILARTSDGIRLHRLVSIEKRDSRSVWITRGDNHEHCDPPLQSEQILGVLAGVQMPCPARRIFRRLGIA